MNQGFFGFPGILNDTNIVIQEFDVSGQFVIPPFAKRIWILLIGSGSGGGGGGRFANGVLSCGGGGGGSGIVLIDDAAIESIGPPGTVLNIVIGAGGAGGAGATADSTAGINGVIGGSSTIGINGRVNTLYTVFRTSTNAIGGASAATANGAGTQTSFFVYGMQYSALSGGGGFGGATAPRGPTTAIPGAITDLWNFGSAGGAGGGGVDTTNTACSGGSIVAGNANTAHYSSYYVGGSTVLNGGAINNPAGGDSSFGKTIMGRYSPGLGGVGGGGSTITDGGAGGNGYRGSGGGGGGGARNGFNGGSGGAGGNGYCVLVAYG